MMKKRGLVATIWLLGFLLVINIVKSDFDFISVKYADPKSWDNVPSFMKQGETRTVTAKMKNCFVLGDWTEYGLITTVSPDCTRAMTISGQELALYPWASGMWQTNSFDVGQDWGTYSQNAWRQDFDLAPNLVNLYDIGWPPLVEANDVNVYYWSKENNWKCVINYPSCVPDASASMRIYGAFSIGIDVYGNRAVYIIGKSKTDPTDMRIWKNTQDYKNWETVSPQDFHPLSGRLQVLSTSSIYTIRDGRLARYQPSLGYWHDVGSSGVMNSFHVFSENDFYILSTDGNIWRYYYDSELGFDRWAQITSGFSVSYFTFKDDNPNDVYVLGSGVIKGQQVSMAHWDGSKWTALGTRDPCYERIKALNDGNKVRLFGLHCSGTAEHFPDYLEIEQDDWGIKKVFMPFSQYLYAGETVDLSFDITAPNTAGCYYLSGTMFTSYGTITDGARMYYHFPRPTYGGNICVEGICGNGIPEWDEQCDNGAANGPYPAECSTGCTINPGPLCGNGIKEGTEECDNGGNNGPYPATCSTICKVNLPPPVPVLIPDLTSTTPSILAGTSKAGRNLTFTGKIVNSGNGSTGGNIIANMPTTTSSIRYGLPLGGESGPSAELSNPAHYVGIPGGYTDMWAIYHSDKKLVYVTDLPEYSERAGICTYPIGSAECEVNTFPILPACPADTYPYYDGEQLMGGNICSIEAPILSGKDTKVVVQYTPGTLPLPKRSGKMRIFSADLVTSYIFNGGYLLFINGVGFENESGTNIVNIGGLDFIQVAPIQQAGNSIPPNPFEARPNSQILLTILPTGTPWAHDSVLLEYAKQKVFVRNAIDRSNTVTTTEYGVFNLPPVYPPIIHSFRPASAPAGSTVEIIAEGGNSPGWLPPSHYSVNFGEFTILDPMIIAASIIRFRVPSNAAVGTYPVSVTNIGGESNKLDFTVTKPVEGAVKLLIIGPLQNFEDGGMFMGLTGKGFYKSPAGVSVYNQDVNSVTFGNSKISTGYLVVEEADGTQYLYADLPPHLVVPGTYDVFVTNPSGTSNVVQFTIYDYMVPPKTISNSNLKVERVISSGSGQGSNPFSNKFTVYDRNVVVEELGGGVIRSLNPKERFPLVSKKWVNVPAGTYRIVLCADSTNKVNEADETNNCNETIVDIPRLPEVCADNIDNDGDRLIDCDDPDCNGVISGTVKDISTSQPISGADVNVLQGLTTLLSLTTDSYGKYSSSVKCGSHTLSASYPEYITDSKSITLPPNGNLITDFNLALGTYCESDCTFYEDNLIHSSCDGINGCTFCDETSRKACEYAHPGWHRDYDATHYVICASGCPQEKEDIPATVTCQSGKTLVKAARIMVYNGKPVKLMVAMCG